ncbi:MAG TPA: L-seryl-tRNA(Sec) selenium transferase [Luteitalea sp.]|nr:L-seryl-tRNA(Sec) selenium transferase [Luteitalea sp.]
MSRARVIPAVDAVLSLPAVRDLALRHGHRAVRGALEHELTTLRADLLAGRSEAATREVAAVLLTDRVSRRLADTASPTPRRVLNATGVVLHTNLGRAPLAHAALEAMREVATDYCDLEFSRDTGGRGSRHTHLDEALREATGADGGLAANNTAAALTVTLAALTAGREVLVSRGELVEIGGGFRMPDIMRGSGAVLREVGTTNRTRAADYAAAIGERTAAILRVHASNFRMEGFTERPALADLVALGRRFGVPVIEDQGSGWLGLDLFGPDDFPAATRSILAAEPAVRDSIRAGVDLVAFSGDKLLGGPQAGLLVGRAALIAQVRAHPLMRAVRVDKLTYAALHATLRAFTDGRATLDVPVMRMLALSASALLARAERLAGALHATGIAASLVAGMSTIGGGSVPGSSLPTTLIALQSALQADALLARLRRGAVPLIARIADDRVVLDPRTLPADSDGLVVRAVAAAVAA